MPAEGWNKQTWDGSYDWRGAGDEWSAPWGGVGAQWFGTLYPRIRAYLPTETALEIAPGFGRWTQFLAKLTSTKLFLVDISEGCIDHCRTRFQADAHVSCHTNDGRSLGMVPDGSLDFVFSFDSLVHVEAEVIDAYLEQLASKMKPDAIGFIHHSNLRPFARHFGILDAIRPTWIRERLLKQRFDFWDHHRSYTMSAELFERMCRAHGLQCLSQELINWGGPLPIDAITTFTPLGSRHARPNRVVRNVRFMHEAAYIAHLAPLYSGGEGDKKEAREGRYQRRPALDP